MQAIHPNESVSLWADNFSMPDFEPLRNNLQVDVCVVGGGIAGVTTAYLLMKEGQRVCLLESYGLGSGQTGRTTAHLSNILEERYFNLEKLHGYAGARLIAESHSNAIHKVARIIREENIDCDFEFLPGHLFLGIGDSVETLQTEYRACKSAGMSDVAYCDTKVDHWLQGPSLCFPKQAQFHPLKYLKKLSELIVAGGGQIYTLTHVEEISSGREAFVKTRDGHTVRCTAIVVATHTPVNDWVTMHTKQYSYRTYAMSFKIPKGKMEKGLYWDTAKPSHYIRLGNEDTLIVGGEDHKTGQELYPEKCFTKLEQWARLHFPFIEEIKHKWSGQVLEPMDRLGYLGRNPGDQNVFIITGDSGNGMTNGTIGAMLIVDLIMNRVNSWEKLYDPSRLSLKGVPTYLKENLNVAAQYADWVTTASSRSLEEMPTNEGRVFRNGIQLIAAYKNDIGDVTTLTAVCPHLGGVVSWNSVEKSWDCPCHGSRFDCHGRVIEGPAIQDLSRVDFEEPEFVHQRVSLRNDFSVTGP
ncbi:MAG: FAD-dependent oxidoreductase [Bdellovibrionaceae bacterium]|nr:FAD-dependent oxidoreductase [Pseudobdellovibrionaceae bacterium]